MALLVEISSQPELKLRGPAFALALLMAPLLVWRRSQPLLSALGGWGIAGLLSVLQVATSGGESGPESMVAVVILLYSLVRWGSGREVLLGAGFVAVIAALGMYSSSVTWAEGIGGTLFLLLIIALAGVFRYRADLGQRRGLEIRNQERLELARE
ncbi:MAG TPA: sensor histidine kinase, partial [Marmoricola sp.]|nr:sensor histidine kinase [Marmoricola sp.]